MRTIFQKRFSLRAMGGIVLNDNRSVANIVLYQRDFTVYTINIGETVVGVVVITGTNNALKSVIGMFNLVAIAISNIGDGTVCVILGCNQRLRTYFYRFKPANRIVCKLFSNPFADSYGKRRKTALRYSPQGSRDRTGCWLSFCQTFYSRIRTVLSLFSGRIPNPENENAPVVWRAERPGLS